MLKRLVLRLLLVAVGSLCAQGTSFGGSTPAGSAFTYQGQLKQSGNLVTATADFQFSLFDVAAGGAPLAAPVSSFDVEVADGQFTVELDFGSGWFNGEARWLEISVRTPAGSGSFTTLAPRQAIQPGPMSQFAMGGAGSFAGDFSGDFAGNGANLTSINAGSLTGALPPSALSGTYTGAVSFTNAANAFVGNGAGLSSLNASNVTSGTLNDSRLSIALLDRIPTAQFLENGGEIISTVNVGGTPHRLAVTGNLAFVVRGAPAILQVVDIENLSSMVLKGSVGFTGGEIAASGNVCVASGSAMRIYSASNPNSPTLVSTTPYDGGTVRPAIAPPFIHLLSSGFPSKLQIFNASSVSAPTLTGSVQTAGTDSVAIAASSTLAVTLDLLDVSAFTSPVLSVIDVSNPAAPVLRSSIPIADADFDSQLAIQGTFVFVTRPTAARLDVYNVVDLANPVLAASVDTIGSCDELVVSGGFAYVLCGDLKLRVYNIANQSNPTFAGNAVLFPDTHDMAISRGHALDLYPPNNLEVQRLTGVRFNQSIIANGGLEFSDESVQFTAFRPTFAGVLNFNNSSNSFNGAFNGSFAGGGSGLTSLNASNVSTGTLDAARLPIGGSWTLSSNLNVDSNSFVVDSNNNRVGIGTASPSVALEVAGFARFTGSGGFSIGSDSSQRRIDSGGASPQLFRFLDSTNAYAGVRLRQASIGGNFGDVTAPVDGMIVQGNVGIGTSTPSSSHRMTVQGEPGVSPVAGAAFYSGANGGTFLGYPTASDSANFELWNASNGYLRFGTNNVERVRFTSTGRVGIGTNAPTTGLHVQTSDSAIRGDTTSAGGIAAHAVSSATSGGGIAVRARVDSATGYSGYFEGVAGSRNYFERMTGVGRVPQINMLEIEGTASKQTAGDWLANSDRRIKTDIRELENALSTIDRLRPVTFRYTPQYLAAHPSIEDVEYYNVIAQEFAEVFPDAVKDSGEKLPTGESILQVDVHPMMITAVAAIQQLRAEKDAEIAELRGRLDELERQLQQLVEAQQGDSE